MRPNSAARIAAVILAVAGLSSLVAAALVATREFSVTAGRPSRHFKCGSVLFAKDPRNRVSSRRNIPTAYKRAYVLCQRTSSDRTHTAITFLVAGAVPLLIVLALPAISRRSRRARGRRRTRL